MVPSRTATVAMGDAGCTRALSFVAVSICREPDATGTTPRE
jgi:hypothetical protein